MKFVNININDNFKAWKSTKISEKFSNFKFQICSHFSWIETVQWKVSSKNFSHNIKRTKTSINHCIDTFIILD